MWSSIKSVGLPKTTSIIIVMVFVAITTKQTIWEFQRVSSSENFYEGFMTIDNVIPTDGKKRMHDFHNDKSLKSNNYTNAPTAKVFDSLSKGIKIRLSTRSYLITAFVSVRNVKYLHNM